VRFIFYLLSFFSSNLLIFIFYYRTFTFWRFLIKVPLTTHEMAVTYSINNGQQIDFWVPGRNQNMRWAAHSVSLLDFLKSFPIPTSVSATASLPV